MPWKTALKISKAHPYAKAARNVLFRGPGGLDDSILGIDRAFSLFKEDTIQIYMCRCLHALDGALEAHQTEAMIISLLPNLSTSVLFEFFHHNHFV